MTGNGKWRVRPAALLLAVLLALTACAPVPEREGEVEKPELEAAPPAGLPAAALAGNPTEPGWVFGLELRHLAKGDEIRIETDLSRLPGFIRMVEDRPLWRRLFPVDTLDAGKKGWLIVTVKRDGRNIYRKRLEIGLGARRFDTQALRVPASMLAARQAAAGDGEDRFQRTLALAARTKGILWSGPFARPVSGRLSTPFGARRSINGEPAYVHGAVDLANRTGTPVLASNRGRVALAAHQGLTGNTVILDHGRGLFTLYAHLDALAVEEGETLERGAVVGPMGSTGFSTGPHLHYAAIFRGLPLDPDLMVERATDLMVLMQWEKTSEERGDAK